MVTPISLTSAMAEYMATAPTRALSTEVSEKAAAHLLDTIAAMVSGADLAAGRMAIKAARENTGKAQASVVMGGCKTGVVEAALANGMLAHADETDDSHAPSLTHPGCAVVPAALAVAEALGASGADLLRAVVAGYDVGPRMSMALGGEDFFRQHHSSHAVGGLFGAVAAAASLYRLPPLQCRFALSYAVQMASGNASWRRDRDHIEKAFDFGGMPAMNGTLAARMVATGFTGIEDAIDGVPGLLSAFPATADPRRATENLGETFEIMRCAIKRWCVGSPIQAALDALELLMAEHALVPGHVRSIVVALPETSAPVVDNREMPDVSMQQQLALMLTDGTVTFHSGHDRARMSDPAIVDLRKRITLDPRRDAEFVEYPRSAIVTITLTDRSEIARRVRHVRGTPGNPMTIQEITDKAISLMTPALGADVASTLSNLVLSIETQPNLAPLVAILREARA